MATSIEAQGLSVDEAIQIALNQLGVSRDKVEIDILHHPRRGILGIGARRAKVRATIRENVMPDGEEFDMSGGDDLGDKPRRRRKRGGRTRGGDSDRPDTDEADDSSSMAAAGSGDAARAADGGDRRGGGRRDQDGGRGQGDRRGGRGRDRRGPDRGQGGDSRAGGESRGTEQRAPAASDGGRQEGPRDGNAQRGQDSRRGNNRQDNRGDGRPDNRPDNRQDGRSDGRQASGSEAGEASPDNRQEGRDGRDNRDASGNRGRSSRRDRGRGGDSRGGDSRGGDGRERNQATSNAEPSAPSAPTEAPARDTSRRERGPLGTVVQPFAPSEDGPMDAETLEGVRARAEELVREMLTKMNFQTEVTSSVDVEASEVVVSVRSDSEGLLIGRRGQTLDSLEHIVNRMALRGDAQAEGRVQLDIGDYRRRRRESLEELATRLRGRASGERRSVQVSPMSPRDRKFFAQAFADDESVEVRALGTGFYRRVIVAPVGAGIDTSVGVENTGRDEASDFSEDHNGAGAQD